MWAWLTPNAEPGDVCRVLRIPIPLLPAFDGAIGLLCDEFRWEQFGDLTPSEAAALGCELWFSYVEGGDVLIGSIHAYAGPFPDGVLPCNGSLYLRVDYPVLYARLDPVFHVDADSFRTPDTRQRFLATCGDIGDTGGESTVTLTTAQMPSHTHTIQNGYGPGVIGADWLGTPLLAPAPTPEITSATGGSQPHENKPPFLCIRYGIVAK